VCPPIEPKEGGTHSTAGRGVRGPDSDDWGKSLALCALPLLEKCNSYTHNLQ